MRCVPTLLLIAILALAGCSDDPAQPDPPATGTVKVVINPTGLQAPWTLDGPNGYSHDGTGDEILADLEVGDYEIAWESVVNWESPLDQSQTLDEDGTITFTGTYLVDQNNTGEVVVVVEPGDLDAGWILTGPYGYHHEGSGDETVSVLVPGEYMIQWQPATHHITPLAQTGTLVATGTLTFTGTYVYNPPTTGTVYVDVEPDDLDANWVLKVETGDGENDVVGSGDDVVFGVPAGEVTLDWEEIPGWEFPGPGYTTETLTGGGTLQMSTTYTVRPIWPLEFVRVEAGSFEMGSPATEPGAVLDEWPQHTVTLTRPLHVSVSEITNAQWDHIMGGKRQGDPTEPNQPVTLISWFLAVDFCNALSLDVGYTPAYTIDGDVTWDPDASGFRLPTEAEWEYFARAGTTTAISAGELAELDCDPDPVLTYYGWYCPNTTAKRPVRSLYPNDWGLYDVHGNVGEFCWDAYASDYYDVSPSVDPPGPAPSIYRVARGGNFLASGAICRSAARQRQRDFEQTPHVGFRVVRNAEPLK